MIRKINILLVIVLISFNAFTQPKKSSRRNIDGVIIYQDILIKTRYYYVPYGLKLVVNKEGRPHFKFIQMRYTGTKVTENENSKSFRSLLSFRVANNIPSKTTINAIILKLRSEGANIQDLQLIAISNLDAELVYAKNEVTDTISKSLKNGFFENTENNSTTQNWKERDFILRLDNEEAQLFRESLQNNRPIISLNYAFLARFESDDFDKIITTGSAEFVKKFERDNKKGKSNKNDLTEVVINGGSLSIDINTKKWPDLIKQIDLNERVPAEYAALDVYCYDFNNAIRDDLDSKRIEIKAISVNGKEVVFKNTFNRGQPDIYAKNIKFIYAVKLSKPYQYRVTQVYKDGTSMQTDWITKKQWHGILDITTSQKIENN